MLSKRISSLSTDQFTQTGMGYADALTTPALMIAGSLSLIYLLFEAVQYLANRSTAPLQIALDVGIPAILAVALISNYSSRMSEFNALLDIMRNIGGSPAGIIDNVVKLYSSVLELVSTCITNAFQAVTATDMPTAGHLAIAAIVLMAINSLIAQAPAIASAITPGTFCARNTAKSTGQITRSTWSRIHKLSSRQ